VTDGQTDRRTDGQTDVKPIAITCFSIADARKKSYMVCRIAPFSMTLNDPKPRFQGQAIL